MRTTLRIQDELFEDLVQLTGARTKTEAVRVALTEFIRIKRKERLLALRGRLQLVDNWHQLRALEVSDQAHD